MPPETLLAPGFIDLQVNGGGGVLLNDEPTPEAMLAISRAHRRFGTTGCLPTLITDTLAKSRAAIAAAQARGRRRVAFWACISRDRSSIPRAPAFILPNE